MVGNINAEETDFTDVKNYDLFEVNYKVSQMKMQNRERKASLCV